MQTLVIENVPIGTLPSAWQTKLSAAAATRVTVRIEAEPVAQKASVKGTRKNPMFGMWSQREDLADVASHVRELRSARVKHSAGKG